MFEHAGQGYAGHGTLCGTLGVSSYLINLVIYDKDGSYRTVIDRMMWWYAGMEFPTERFDDISAFPKQVKVQAMTPLCHTSVSKWTLAAGAQVTSKEKYERCAKVGGDQWQVGVKSVGGKEKCRVALLDNQQSGEREGVIPK